MANIYDGSFVLGSTSATTLSAGPGIKLDTSVPGVIGIGTDETVLWEANTSTTATLRETTLKQGSSAVNFVEPKSHFEKLEVWAIWNPNAGQGQTVITTYPASNSAGGYVIQAGDRGNYMAKGAWSATDTTFKVHYAAQSDSWPNFGANDSYGGVIKIVGINRISGGN